MVIDHLAAAPAADRQQPVMLLRQIEYSEVSDDIVEAIRNHIAALKDEQTRLAEARLQQRLDEIKKRKDS